MNVEQLCQDYDWKCAFADEGNVSCGNCTKDLAAYGVTDAEFSRCDVAEVLASVNGENDGPDWVGVFRLKDERFATVTGGCDYTGWD